MSERKLRPKEETFASEFARTRNRRAAAILAGVSEKSASQTASQMLADPLVQARVKEITEELRAASRIERQDVINLLAGATRADLADVFPDNQTLQAAKQKGISRYIKKFEVFTVTITRKDESVETRSRERVEMYDWMAAVKQLADLLGWQPDTGVPERPVQDVAAQVQETFARLKTVFGEEEARALLLEEVPEAGEWLTSESAWTN